MTGAYVLQIEPAAGCAVPAGPHSIAVIASPTGTTAQPGSAQVLPASGGSALELEFLYVGDVLRGGLGTTDEGSLTAGNLRLYMRTIGTGPVTHLGSGRGEVLSGTMFGDLAFSRPGDDELTTLGVCTALGASLEAGAVTRGAIVCGLGLAAIALELRRGDGPSGHARDRRAGGHRGRPMRRDERARMPPGARIAARDAGALAAADVVIGDDGTLGRALESGDLVEGTAVESAMCRGCSSRAAARCPRGTTSSACARRSGVPAVPPGSGRARPCSAWTHSACTPPVIPRRSRAHRSPSCPPRWPAAGARAPRRWSRCACAPSSRAAPGRHRAPRPSFTRSLALP